MNTINHIRIAAPFDAVFQRAADIARWPEILPHYRYVKVISRNGPRVIAEMAARHRGLPLWWKTIQTAYPEERRIHFTHIGGITKGMEVDWIFEEASPTPPNTGGVSHRERVPPLLQWRGGEAPLWNVSIHHAFQPPWSAVGRWFAEHVIGRVFVQQVAQKTLACMKQGLEGTSR